MPYFITESNPECSGWAVVDDGDGYYGCHTTKQSAIDQAVAISISDDEPFEGERAGIDTLNIGDYVSWNPLDPEIVAEVVAVEGQMAVLRLYEEDDGIFEATDKLMILNIFKLERIVRPEMIAEEFEEIDQPEEMQALDVLEVPNDAEESNSYLGRAKALIARIEAKEESNGMSQTPTNEARDKWVRAAWAIKAQLENLSEEARSLGKTEIRTEHADLEIRETGDGMTFEGYAAVFNSPSQPLPFIETIKPGAFKRSLQGRHRMMLLWNHNASEPLASTRNGSLKLVEDARGLKVTATLANTQTGRDVAELLRSKTIDAMSFGFQVKKDSWSADGNYRTLEEVAVHEVSLTSFPAYEGTAGTTSVREKRDIDADQLADSLMKLESGEELDAEQAKIINDVVEKLTKTEEVQEVEGDILALKKKKLDLILKGI
jgi:HK97 family phage prohead protease